MDYLRVTEILYPFSGLKYVDAEVLERACVRGTKVHKICEGIVRGIEGWEIPEDYQGYIKSFRSWWDQGRIISSIEERFYCDDLCITGQVDLVVEGPKGAMIVDLKTSQQESKSWWLQGSAYAYLAKKKGYDVKEIMFLKLNRDGKPAREYFYEENMELFSECLNVYRYFYGKRPRKTK